MDSCQACEKRHQLSKLNACSNCSILVCPNCCEACFNCGLYFCEGCTADCEDMLKAAIVVIRKAPQITRVRYFCYNCRK